MRKHHLLNPVLRFYWRHALQYPRILTGLLIALPVTILMNTYLPALILANVLTKLASHQYIPHHLWASFGHQLLLYFGLLLLGSLCWRIVDFCMWRLEANVGRDLAQQVFGHLQDESADFHANNFSGSMVSQTNKLLGGYVRVADTVIFQTYPLISGVIIASCILAFRAPVFVVCLLILVFVYMIVAFVAARPVRELGAKFAATESRQTGYLADAVTNAMAIKSFARGDYERRRFAAVTTDTHDSLMRFARRHQVQMNTLALSNRVIQGGSLFMAVLSVLVFNVQIGTVFLIFNYTAGIVEQLFQFGNNGLRNFNRAIGDATDMLNILQHTPEILDPESPEPVQIRRGSIEFNNVTFTHKGADDALFEGLSLRIKPGEKIGLVGHSGSGKTTFTRLLLRFSDIQGGEIKIDGQNIAKITQDDLHRHIAYVPQEPLLFHRTIAENIGYGNLEAGQQAIEGVAKLAHAHEFVQQLPKGYDTLVGERGVKLSGGQRQRVAIARAMLKNAPILALDEATSALDSESEVLIQDALWKLMEGRTAIVIAHRLSTIQKMDRIIVLDEGKIVEQGSHKDLLRANGTYAKLWAHQSGGFIDE